MIAPVGYVPLVDLLEEAYEYEYEDENEIYDYILGKNGHLALFLFEMPDDIAKKWVMEFCSNSLYLHNGSSEPIRISDQIFKSSFYWGLMNHRHGDSTIEKFGLTDELLAPYQVCEPVSKDDMSAFNTRLEELSREEDLDKAVSEDEISQTLIRKYCDERGFALPCLFLDHRSYTVSLNLFNHLSKFDEETRSENLDEDVYHKADILRKFVGYSLCIPEELYLKNWENFWKGKGNRELQKYQNCSDNESERDTVSTVAKEKKAENRFRNFISENGAPKITKGEFYLKFGIGLSDRGKNRVWTAVAKDFSYLSRPGRKS
jgi:hypothetical protein